MLPRSTKRRLAAEDGFSIVEVLVASVVLVVGLLGTLTLVDTANTTTFQTKSREQATALQREIVEAVRAVSYDQLAPASLAGAVRGREALDDSGASAGWTIRRRDTTYTVAVSSCIVDDPRDGRAPGRRAPSATRPPPTSPRAAAGRCSTAPPPPRRPPGSRAS
jgi:Tfp pilus assembly protein PilV